MTESFDNHEAERLLLQASAAKTNPLTPDASRELEACIVDEIVKGTSEEEQAEFRAMLNASGFSTWELNPDAPTHRKSKPSGH